MVSCWITCSLVRNIIHFAFSQSYNLKQHTRKHFRRHRGNVIFVDLLFYGVIVCRNTQECVPKKHLTCVNVLICIDRDWYSDGECENAFRLIISCGICGSAFYSRRVIWKNSWKCMKRSVWIIFRGDYYFVKKFGSDNWST